MSSTVRPTALGGSSHPRYATVLMATAALSVVGLLVAVVGLAADPTLITGVPAWLKPAKFAVSIALYCATLAWMLSLVQGHRRLVRVVAGVTGVALLAELVLIAVQAARGTTSHFNVVAPVDEAIFSAMGALVALVFLAAMTAGVLLLLQRRLPPVLGAGIRGGLAVAVLGMSAAILMLANNDFAPGGAHTVGAADGGPGLPLTGWSTAHGDLRVAHFVGLHCLQLLPLVGWLLQRYATGLTETAQLRLVRLGTGAAAGSVVLLAWQAERGLPLLRPDVPVLTAALVGAAVVAGLAGLVVARGRRS
jgi:hypothetical protein